MYKSKNHSVLGIYTSGLTKHRSDIFMANNYDHVDHVDYFVLLAILIICNNFCLNVCVEITI